MLPDYLETLERRDRQRARRAARARLLRAPFLAIGSWFATAWLWGTSAFAATPFDESDSQSAFSDDAFDDDWASSDVHEDRISGSSFDQPFDSQSHDVSGTDINPATGLPMVGGLDTGGNAYGCSETEWSGIHSSEW